MATDQDDLSWATGAAWEREERERARPCRGCGGTEDTGHAWGCLPPAVCGWCRAAERRDRTVPHAPDCPWATTATGAA